MMIFQTMSIMHVFAAGDEIGSYKAVGIGELVIQTPETVSDTDNVEFSGLWELAADSAVTTKDYLGYTNGLKACNFVLNSKDAGYVKFIPDAGKLKGEYHVWVYTIRSSVNPDSNVDFAYKNANLTQEESAGSYSQNIVNYDTAKWAEGDGAWIKVTDVPLSFTGAKDEYFKIVKTKTDCTTRVAGVKFKRYNGELIIQTPVDYTCSDGSEYHSKNVGRVKIGSGTSKTKYSASTATSRDYLGVENGLNPGGGLVVTENQTITFTPYRGELIGKYDVYMYHERSSLSAKAQNIYYSYKNANMSAEEKSEMLSQLFAVTPSVTAFPEGQGIWKKLTQAPITFTGTGNEYVKIHGSFGDYHKLGINAVKFVPNDSYIIEPPSTYAENNKSYNSSNNTSKIKFEGTWTNSYLYNTSIGHQYTLPIDNDNKYNGLNVRGGLKASTSDASLTYQPLENELNGKYDIWVYAANIANPPVDEVKLVYKTDSSASEQDIGIFKNNYGSTLTVDSKTRGKGCWIKVSKSPVNFTGSGKEYIKLYNMIDKTTYAPPIKFVPTNGEIIIQTPHDKSWEHGSNIVNTANVTLSGNCIYSTSTYYVTSRDASGEYNGLNLGGLVQTNQQDEGSISFKPNAGDLNGLYDVYIYAVKGWVGTGNVNIFYSTDSSAGECAAYPVNLSLAKLPNDNDGAWIKANKVPILFGGSGNEILSVTSPSGCMTRMAGVKFVPASDEIFYDAMPISFKQEDDGSITAETIVVSTDNTKKQAVLVIAGYKNDALEFVDYSPIADLSAAPSKLSAAIDLKGETSIVVRAFLWENFTTIRPLSEDVPYSE